MEQQQNLIHPLLALLIVIGATVLVVPAMLIAFLFQGFSGVAGIASVYWMTAGMIGGLIWQKSQDVL